MHYVVINIAKEFPCFPEGNSILLLLTSSYRIIYNKNVIVKVKLLSRVRLFGTLWTVARHAPLSMGFSGQEYWSGLPFHNQMANHESQDFHYIVHNASLFSQLGECNN